MPRKFGIKTLFFYLYQRVTLGIVLLILAVSLPEISRFIFSMGNVNLGTISIENIDKIGNIVMVVAILLSFAIIILGIVLSFVKYISNTYTIGDYALTFRRGLIAKMEIVIPYKQIQSVDINQSILFRILGLSSIVILSAGIDERKEGSTGDQIFNVIDISIAQHLRQELLKRANLTN